ncbi:MAG: preprotein translocase subunit SecE [Acidobacteriota bacterium]|nr:preprotein translocase subunit SecE [Acidobacteriota bacterium]
MAKTVVAEETPNTGIDNLKATPGRLSAFLKDVRSEMRKVIAPSREEVQSTTITVLLTVFIFAAYFWVIDGVIGRAIEAVLNYLTKH